MFANPLTERLAAFVRGIGIAVRAATLPGDTILLGLDIRHGAILIDEARLAHPGDILHEAPTLRGAPTLAPDGGDEMGSVAWSYAALRHLELDPAVVFHAAGYKGGAASLIENFTAGRFIGVPLLQDYGMTVEPQRAAALGVEPHPHMLRWMR